MPPMSTFPRRGNTKDRLASRKPHKSRGIRSRDPSSPRESLPEIKCFGDEVALIVNADRISVIDWTDRLSWSFATQAEAMDFAGRRAHVHANRRQRKALGRLGDGLQSEENNIEQPLWRGPLVAVDLRRRGW